MWLENFRPRSGCNFWNRSYFDYFLKVGEGFNFTALEMSTSQIYVVGRETSGQIAQNVLGRAPHTLRHFDAPFNRYQHMQLPASSWNNFYQLSGQDEYIPPEEVELHLRARLWPAWISYFWRVRMVFCLVSLHSIWFELDGISTSVFCKRTWIQLLFLLMQLWIQLHWAQISSTVYFKICTIDWTSSSTGLLSRICKADFNCQMMQTSFGVIQEL